MAAEDAGEDGGPPVVGGQGGQGEAEGAGRGQEQGAQGQALAAVGAAAEVQEVAEQRAGGPRLGWASGRWGSESEAPPRGESE